MPYQTTRPRPFFSADRDQLYGQPFRHRVKGIGIEELLTAPRSPWQNQFAERLMGSIRRECLNHALVLGERPAASPTTMRRVPTSTSTRTLPTSGPSNDPWKARSCSFPKSAACTIATSARRHRPSTAESSAQPETPHRSSCFSRPPSAALRALPVPRVANLPPSKVSSRRPVLPQWGRCVATATRTSTTVSVPSGCIGRSAHSKVREMDRHSDIRRSILPGRRAEKVRGD